jgi:hypothetical protein
MRNLQNFETFTKILESQMSYKDGWNNIGFFTVGGERHEIKKLVDRGDHYGIITTNDRIFNSKILDSLDKVTKEEKIITPKEKLPREKSSNMTTREYMKMCKDIANSGNKDDREEYDHSEFYDMAQGLVTTDDNLKNYLMRKIQREESYNPSVKDCIDKMVNDLESYN